MTNYQKLEFINLVGKSGQRFTETRNGNNAAWVCCTDGCSEPLLGSGLGSVRDKLIQCGECGATYQVRFWENKPSEVHEIKMGQAAVD